MQFVVLANDSQMQELLSQGQTAGAEVVWLQTADQFADHKNADVYCDLLFDDSDDRINLLKNVGGVVIINSVDKSLKDLQQDFIRINGWQGFLKGSMIEASCLGETKKQEADDFFSLFDKKIEWLPDEPGFVSARIVSMIINEAYFALSEGVSSRNEIDTAMKLGTNYPYGPFEWSEKIGLKKVHSLLSQLATINSRYKPAPLLEKEALI